MIDTKAGAATVSVVSNSLLVAAKIAAGAITGSIAIITEALHSLIDLGRPREFRRGDRHVRAPLTSASEVRPVSGKGAHGGNRPFPP